ncbi:hypothetical protein IGI04_042760 [Brassica rapa subsp. trilocularis]|uniref:Uncharacterized protein n=2 Tax=Brassica rapa subsp. trilocularis TaxID=1813537 RepID=A0ABQ7KKD1_BRACM|nr:hypothetical protein IGI04_042760 [Brassica rapa subsp. trilocularis]
MDSNYLNMEMKHRSSTTMELEEERDGDWSRWAKRALESCGLWSSHGKGKPFMEMATEEGQTRGLKLGNEVVQGDTTKSEIEATLGKSKLVRVVEDRGVIRGLRQGEDECYQLVGRLREVWSELDVVKTHTSNPRCCQERRKQDVIFSFLMEEVCELVKYTCDVWDMNRKPERWKGGTSCKRGRLRKLSKEWLMKRRAWRKDSESEHLSDRMSVILKRIKDVLQQMVIGECSYSAYMGETVGDSADMRGMDTKRADECVTKKEWDEEAGGTTPLDHERGNGSESGEQEHNQEDSGQHDQEETHEVESGAQSGGNEQGEPTGLREEAQKNPVPACRDALPLSINGHMPSLVKAKHDQTVNFFSR